MNVLAHWQRALAARIDGATPGEATLLANEVPGLSVARGCAVYRSSSQAARTGALADVYPVCRRLLGERSFNGLAAEFVRRVPSTGPDLNRFGDGFAAFVEHVVTEQAAFAGLPWLVELVALEWSCHTLYYACDDAPFDFAALADVDPAQLRPRPVAALDWLHCHWPVDDIWLAHDGDAMPAVMHIEPGERYLVVERRSFVAQVVSVDVALWRLLDACARGVDLAALAADPTLDVGRLGELVSRGWLSVERRADVV